MSTNQYIDHKANKLGVEITYNVEAFEGENLETWSFVYGKDTLYAFSLTELENTLDDCLDGGFFRQAEAEADERFADMAYGPMDIGID
jgi:hypothetical protein